MADDNSKIVPLRPGSLPSGAVPRPVQKLQELAREHLTRGLREVFNKLDDTFFDMAELADNARQQTLYFDAMRLIRMQRKPIESRFFSSIDQRLIGISTPGNQSVAPIKKNSGSQGFQLIDEDDLEEIIALDTMVSRCLEGSAKALEELNSRLRSLFPQIITAHNNPYGPEELCDIFNESTGNLEIDVRSKLLLFKLFERNVMNTLEELYHKANQLLQELGFEAVDTNRKKPVIKKTETSPSRQSANPVHKQTAKEAEEKPSAGTSSPKRYTSSERHGRLVNRINRLFKQTHRSIAVDSGYEEAALDDVLEQIADIKAGISEAADSGIGVVKLVEMLESKLQNGHVPARLNDYDHNVVQLVDDLLNRFDEHSAIPPDISAGLQKLKLPLLQLALQDNSFFDKEKHPARRLLNEVAQLSVRFEDDVASRKDPLYSEIKQLMEQLLEQDDLDTTTLTTLFAEFLAQVDKYERRVQAIEKRVLEEVAASEKVNHAHTQVARQLAGMLEGKMLPEALVELAESAWSKVLFLTFLKSGCDSPQWQTDISLLEGLVELLESESPQLETFAAISEQVRKRLADSSFDNYKLGVLMGRLEQYCIARSSHPDRDKPGTGNEPEKAVLVEAFRTNLPGEANTDETESANQHLTERPELREGNWFDLQADSEQRKRCKLIGEAEKVGKYVFVNRLGNLEETFSNAGLVRQLEENRLKLLDNTNLFDRALEQVIQEIRYGEQGSTRH